MHILHKLVKKDSKYWATTSEHNRRYPLLILLLVLTCSCSLLQSKKGGNDYYSLLVDEERSMFSDENMEKTLAKSSGNYSTIRALLAKKNNNYKDAETFLEVAIEDTTNNGTKNQLSKELAALQIQNGNLEEALQTSTKIANLSASDALLKLAIAYQLEEDLVVIEQFQNLKNTLETSSELISTARGLLYASIYRELGPQRLTKELTTNPSSEHFFDNYILGAINENEGNLQVAIKHYELATQAQDSVSLAYRALARAYLKAGDTESAKTALPKSLSDRSHTIMDYFAQLSQYIGSEEAFTNKNNRQRLIGVLSENYFDPTWDIGRYFLESKAPKSAIPMIQLSVSGHPGDGHRALILARLYAYNNQQLLAEQQLESVPQNDPYFATTSVFFASVLNHWKRPEKAAIVISELIDTQDDNKPDLRMLNLLYSLQKSAKNYVRAIETLQRIMEHAPQSDRLYAELGFLQHQVGNIEESIESLEKSIKLNPEDPMVLNFLGYTYAEEGKRLDRAEKLLLKALEKQPDSGHFIDSLGWVYFKQGRYGKAKDQLEKAAKLTPNDAVILEHLAIIYQRLGLNNKAHKTFIKALNNAPLSEDDEIEDRIKRTLEELN